MPNNFKEIKTRIALKQGSYDYWVNGAGKEYIPLYGEVCFCEIPAPEEYKNPQENGSQHATTAPTVLFKVGTGDRVFKDLNWASAPAADVYDWAKQTPEKFVEWLGDQDLISVTKKTGETTTTETYTIQEYADNAVGNLSNLQTANKNTLVDAINAVLQAVNVGGTGSVVTIAKLATPTEGSAATYQLYQGVDENGLPTPVGEKIEIPVSTKVEASDRNGYLMVDDAEVQVFNDIFSADGKTVTAVGGIASGTEVNGKTFQELFYDMMFPYQKPTLTATASPNGGTYMKGNTQTVTKVTVNVTKKTDNIAKVELFNSTSTLNTSTLVEERTGDAIKAGGKVEFTVSRSVSSDGGQYRARVTDARGSTATADTTKFTFINPFYYGVCAANAQITNTVVTDLGLTSDLKGKPSGKNTVDFNYTTNSQRMVIAYPSAYGDLKSIKDGNGLENLSTFANKYTVSITNEYGNTESYYVYTNGVTSGSATMKFAFAV